MEQVLLAQQESQARRAPLVQRELWAQQVLRGRRQQQARPGRQVLREQRVLWVLQARLGLCTKARITRR